MRGDSRGLRRLVYALPGGLLAIVLVLHGGNLATAAAVVAAVDVLACAYPWRIPRGPRSGVSYWTESSSYLLPMTALAVWAIARSHSYMGAPAGASWWVLGGLAGLVLLTLTGIDPRKLLSGELAFLSGPSKVSHSVARAFTALAGPFSEESFFRGAILFLGRWRILFVVLGGVTFVSRHHLVVQVAPRRDARTLLVEGISTILFTTLALGSGSIYPGLLAHVINNAPIAVLQIQQVRLSRGAGDA